MSTTIIFDFDGTLVDSGKLIYECFQAITHNIASERINNAKNILIGPPLRETASEILGPKYRDKLDEFVRMFIEMHDKNVIKYTSPYPHVIEILKKLSKKKIPMAIATNKRQAPTYKLIKYFGWQDYFSSIECSDSQKFLRNKDEMITDILNSENNFNDGFLIGDTVNDALCANLNQLKFIRASYGYGRSQDWSKVKIEYTIKNFIDLGSIFL